MNLKLSINLLLNFDNFVSMFYVFFVDGSVDVIEGVIDNGDCFRYQFIVRMFLIRVLQQILFVINIFTQ